MPNMTWVIGRGGHVAYKANWTSAANVEAFLGRFLAGHAEPPPGTSPVMYETQQAVFRYTDRKEFMRHLQRDGTRAVAAFEKARQLWAGRAATWTTKRRLACRT